MRTFSHYIGIDYSGAETPEASLKGLRVYCAEGESAANEVPPPPSPRKYWTRRGTAHWLAGRLAEDVPTIVGIDHGFFQLCLNLRHAILHLLDHLHVDAHASVVLSIQSEARRLKRPRTIEYTVAASLIRRL